MPSLDECYLWLQRAGEHLGNLDQNLIEFVNAQARSTEESFKVYPQSGGGIPPFSIRGPEPEVPKSASIFLGEYVQALRRSLDYLVYQLAILDSGRERKGTQFPTDNSADDFRRHKNTHLKGLSDVHVAAIERLQPYNGVNWTKTLAFLSNQDKHRRLVVGVHSAGLSVRPGEADAQPGTAVISVRDNRTGRVEIHFLLSFEIFLEDGSPIVQTLRELQAGVRGTVDAFRPEFERS